MYHEHFVPTSTSMLFLINTCSATGRVLQYRLQCFWQWTCTYSGVIFTYVCYLCAIPGGPQKTEQSIQSIFRTLLWSTVIFLPCWIEHLFLIIITPRSSNLVENFLFYELFLMDRHFRDLPDFQSSRGTINDSFSSTCAKTYQHSTSYKEISVPITCLDCKSLLGNTRITEHNTRSIYGRPKLSLIVSRNSGNRANPENDSP